MQAAKARRFQEKEERQAMALEYWDCERIRVGRLEEMERRGPDYLPERYRHITIQGYLDDI